MVNGIWRAEYPFYSHYLDIDGQRMHYLDEGQGEPIVMLHGNPTWSFYYRRLVTAFRTSHRVIAPDHIGCGLSDKPQDYPYTLRQHIDNLERLLQHLELEHITLVVHDWGGAIGMGYALRHIPQIRRFVIFNTAAWLSDRCPRRIRICRIPLIGELAVRGLNGFAGAATRMAVEQRMSRRVKAGYLAPYDNWSNRIATLRFVQDIPLSETHPSHATLREIEAGLPELVNRPMLIVWGMKDWCFQEHFLMEWARRFPHAEIHRAEGAGHYVVEEAHDQIEPLMRRFVSPEPQQ